MEREQFSDTIRTWGEMFGMPKHITDTDGAQKLADAYWQMFKHITGKHWREACEYLNPQLQWFPKPGEITAALNATEPETTGKYVDNSPPDFTPEYVDQRIGEIVAELAATMKPKYLRGNDNATNEAREDRAGRNA